jgi:outer membrane protein assembly factor BamA
MRAAGLIFLTLSLLALAPRLAAQDLYGTRVVEVSIDGAEPAALADLPLQPGDLLTRSAVRAAIQTLYDRGRFSRIAV